MTKIVFTKLERSGERDLGAASVAGGAAIVDGAVQSLYDWNRVTDKASLRQAFDYIEQHVAGRYLYAYWREEADKETSMDQTTDRLITEADKLRGTFGLPPAEAQAAPEPAEAEKALSWVDRLRVTFGFPPLSSTEKRYDPDQPRAPKGDPDGGQWTSDVRSPDRRGRFSGIEARGLISLMTETGGFSYQPFDDFSPKDGYMVSIYEERGEVMAPSEVGEKRFGRYVNRNRDLLVKENHFFGGWLDTEENMVALDVSIRAKTAEEAHRLACEHDQKAYWDVKNFLEVRVEC